jgi:preprotein translocase subunit YajC
MDMLTQLAPIALLIILFYVLLIRPQQKRQKDHQTMVQSLKRGDTIVMSSGMIGKVVRVEEAEVGVEIAQGVTVKVVKGMIAEVRARGAPAAANDAKS